MHDDGRNAEKDSIVLGPGQTKPVTLTLGELPPWGSDKLLIKVIDGSNINEPDPLEDVKVLVYKNKSRIDTIYTDEYGIAEKSYAIESYDHMDLVLLYDDYLVRIFPGINLVSANSNNPKEIKMFKIEGHDYATVNVEVLSFGSNEQVDNAAVYLYDADTNLMVHESTKYTDDEGLAIFKYLPDNSYFAIAKDDFTGTEGESETEYVLRGEEITLTINLVLGMGNFKVKIVDFETQDPITQNGYPMVSVKAYNPVTNEYYDTNKHYFADDDGVAETDDFTIDKQYVLEISHENYVTRKTEPLQAIDNTTVEPQENPISLFSNSNLPSDEITLEFMGIYTDPDLDSSHLAPKIRSGDSVKIYYVNYKLHLSKPGIYYDTAQYIIVESDIEIDSLDSGYVIKIHNITASGVHTPTMSKCYDEAYPYSTPSGCPTSGDAKQVRINWDELDGESIYTVTAEIWIEPNLEDGTPISIKSRAKTNYEGEDYEIPQAIIKPYNINETACEGSNCPKFSYDFQMTGPNPNMSEPSYVKKAIRHYETESDMPNADGQFEDTANLPDPDDWFTLFRHNEYKFYYAVQNITQDPPEDFGGVSLFLDSEHLGVHDVINSGNLDSSNTLKNDNAPWLLSPIVGNPGFMTFEVSDDPNLDEIYGKSIMFFKILNGNMKVETQPSVITPNAYPTITIEVTGQRDSSPDAEYFLLDKANVDIYLRKANRSIPTIPDDSGATDDGIYEYVANESSGDPLPELGDTYVIKITKNNYLPKTVKIPVTASATGNFNPAYGCISVTPEFLEIDKLVMKTFTIETMRTINGVDIECNEEINISFGTKLDVTPKTITLDRDPDTSEIPDSKTFEVTVPTRFALGLYPIYVLGKFVSDDQVFHADTIKTNITDESGSCLYKIDPFIYDFKGEDSLLEKASEDMIIYNQCWVSPGIEDVFMPSLASDSAKISLNPGQEVPVQMRFTWTVKVNTTDAQGEHEGEYMIDQDTLNPYYDSTIIFPGRESEIEQIYIGKVSVWDLMYSVGYPANINAETVTFTPVVKEIQMVLPDKPLLEYCNTNTGEDCIDIWLEGQPGGESYLNVYVSYRGKDTRKTGHIESPVYNVDVRSNDYVMITARDYVSEIKWKKYLQ